jgi:hypothetical protein
MVTKGIAWRLILSGIEHHGEMVGREWIILVGARAASRLSYTRCIWFEIRLGVLSALRQSDAIGHEGRG